MNDMLTKHPMNGVRYTKPVRAVDDINSLTVDEQEKFLEVAKHSHNYRQYVLLLETGLRTSEMIVLTWDAIDWKKRTLSVSKTLEYRHGAGIWRAGPPKTASSYRTIPLTTQAYDAFQKAKDKPGFKAKHEAELVIFEAARSTLLAMQGDEKLPSLKTLQAEQAQLFEEQERLYAERNRFKKEAKQIETIKSNVDTFLAPSADHDRDHLRSTQRE